MQISLNPFPLGLTTEVEAKPLPDKHKHNIVWEAFIMHTVPVDALGRAQNSASGAQGSVLCSVRGWSWSDGGWARGWGWCAVKYYWMNKFKVFRHLDFLIKEKKALSCMLYSIIYYLACPYFRLVNSHMTRMLHSSQSWLLSWCVLEYFMAIL